ncbi:MAG: DUF2357 domain-containing protein [Treponema sp.]|jgi:hypothetical protein|nr:DUF2357 domain-containing protein [Treponema sp.]
MDNKKYLKEVFGLSCSPENARELLFLCSWFTRVAEFDPVSGDALHTDIDRLCKRINEAVFKNSESFNTREGLPEPNEDNALKDHLYHICDYVYNSLPVVCERLRTTIKRDHAVLPFYAVREIDSSGIIWLLKRSGRNIREKIADKKAVLAVRRRQSINTLENRLVKKFMRRLLVKLEKRANILPGEHDKTCSNLLQFLHRALHSEMMEEIGPWQNSQPNNILLHDKHYHKIWRAWKSLNALDSKLSGDFEHLPETRLTAVFWTLLSTLKTIDECRIVQQPVDINYDERSIKPVITASGVSRNRGEWSVILYDKKIVFSFLENNNKHVIESSSNGLKLNDKPVLGFLKDAIIYITKIIFGKYDSINNENPIKKNDDEISGILTEALFGKIEKPLVEYAVIDIYSIRPEFILQNENIKKMPFRLLRQEWKEKGIIDCGESKALLLDNDEYKIETTSMKSYFLDSGIDTHETLTLSTISFFVEKLFTHLEKELKSQTRRISLHYLVPDWIEDFELMELNRGIHFYWQNAFPLPRSIAGVTAWQSSNEFQPLEENTLVLVVDSLENGISVTPLECIKEKQLIHETRGYRWDRYPTFILPVDNEKTLQNFENEGYDRRSAQIMLKLFGIDGILREAEKLSVMYGGKWNHISKEINKVFSEITINYKTLNEKLNELKINKFNKKIYILPLQEKIAIDDKKNIVMLNYTKSLTKGGETAVLWQKEALKKGFSFWRNHLPNLAADFPTGGFSKQRIYLVKDKTTIPMQMESVVWNVENFKIRLAKGNNFFEYPLIQGSGEKTVQYAARLKTPVSLEYDIDCRLEMTYTYGKDMPYNLRFIPADDDNKNKAPFDYLDASFERLDEENILNTLKVPSFPKAYSWEELKRTNILSRCEKNLQCLNDIADVNVIDSTVERMKLERMEGKFIHWQDIRKKDYFWTAVDELKEHNVFCHINDFFENDFDINLLKENDIVFFKINESERGYSGKKITFSEKCPPKLIESYCHYIYNDVEERIKRSKTDVALIWNNGRSLRDSAADNEFRNSMFNIIQSMEKLLKTEAPANVEKKVFSSIKLTLRYFLCCINQQNISGDTMEFLKEEFVKTMKNESIKFSIGNIGRFLGEAEHECQLMIFHEVLNLIYQRTDDFISYPFEILAIALWRNENLVYKFPERILESIASKLHDSLKRQIPKLGNDRFTDQSICRHLEVLLALLRTRSSANRAVKKLFAPQSELTDAFMALLEKLDKESKEKNIPIKSRLNFEEENAGERKSMGIIDVLRIYLISDIGSSNIMVVSVNEQDD